MSMRISPPDLAKCKTYERYKQELLAWRKVTDVAKDKQAIAIALSLPHDPDQAGIRDQVFEELDMADLSKDTGLETLMTFLDGKLGVDDLADSLAKFEDFEDYCRGSGESILDYIAKFDQKYKRLVKLKMELPSAIVAFKLLRRANITSEERLLVLTGMDYSQKDTLYEQAQMSLKKFKGEQPSCGGSVVLGSRSGPGGGVAIKVEPAFSVEQEEAMLAAGYGHDSRQRGRNSRGSWRGSGSSRWRGSSNVNRRSGDVRSWRRSDDQQGNWRSGAGRSQMQGGYSGGRGNDSRPLNPVGPDGNTLLCVACGSFRHLVADCPDSWERRGSTRVNIAESDGVTEKATLFTGPNRDSL